MGRGGSSGGKDGEVRTGNTGQNGGGEWNVSQEAAPPRSVGTRASAAVVLLKQATSQRVGVCV